MLDLALKHEEQIKLLFMDTWYDDKYKYYHCAEYYVHETPDNDERSRNFVSLDSNGEVIGYISYGIHRDVQSACNFAAINFTDNKITFGLDLAQVIDDIFMKFNMNRLDFRVIIGNPIEKNYDKMVSKFGGRIVGIERQIAKLYDGEICDSKIYEILREDYIKAKENNHGK